MSAKKYKSADLSNSRRHRSQQRDGAATHGLYHQAEQLTRLGHYEWDDANQRLIACSEGYARIFEMTVDQVLAEASEYEDDLNLVHPEDRQRYLRQLSEASGSGDLFRAEYRIVTRSGAVRHVREVGETQRNEDHIRFGTLLDITEQKDTESALRASHNVLKAIIDGTPDLIFVKDLNGRYTTLNLAAAGNIGRPMEDIIGKTCLDLFPPEIAAATWREDQQVLKARRPLFFEHLSGTDDQILSTTKYVYYDDRGQPLGIIGISRDITERKRAEDKIRHLAYHDELTSLPSIRLAKDRLASAIARAQREKLNAALLYLDLDDFKKINDVMGHKAGDQVLINVADRLKDCVRKTDTVARVGGDEFIVVLTGERVIPATVAGKIIAALAKPILVDDRPVSVAASIGIAVYPRDGDTPEQLIDRADEVMYQVKRSGKNNFAIA